MNWSEIIAGILHAGWSEKWLAEHSGASVLQIRRLISGETEEPRYSVGARLIEIHGRAKAAGLCDPYSGMQPRRGKPVGLGIGNTAVEAEVRDLIGAGLSCAAIARRILVADATVRDWRDGARATERYAERITTLRRRCGEAGVLSIARQASSTTRGTSCSPDR